MKGPKGGLRGCEAEFGASFLTFHLGLYLTTNVDVIATVGYSFLYNAACAITHQSDRLIGTNIFSFYCVSQQMMVLVMPVADTHIGWLLA